MAGDKPDVAQVSEKNTTGELDPSIWEEAQAVTGRPNDTPEENSTFGSRAKSAVNADTAKADEPTKATKKATARKK